jgi:uncharacterized protein (DUF697 family)
MTSMLTVRDEISGCRAPTGIGGPRGHRPLPRSGDPSLAVPPKVVWRTEQSRNVGQSPGSVNVGLEARAGGVRRLQMWYRSGIVVAKIAAAGRYSAPLSSGGSMTEQATISNQSADLSRPTKEAEAMRVVREYIGWSTGAGLIPVPLVDLAAISLVELKMVHSLANLYGVPFSRSAAKSIIGALIGGGGTFVLAAPAASVVKFVPVVGQFFGVLTEPAIAAAATYALGKVFIQHFESGGTLLDFNIRTQRHQYEEHFAAAQQGNDGAGVH